MREYLKDLRRNTAMTQDDVSRLLHISRSSYTNIENGERQNDMSLSMIQQIAVAFGMATEEIVALEEKYQAEKTAASKAG